VVWFNPLIVADLDTTGAEFSTVIMPGGKKKSDKKRRQKLAENTTSICQEVVASNPPTNNNHVQGVAKSLFSLVDIPGKGEGLVASANLVPGTIIVEEKPLIVVDSAFAVIQVLPKFQALSDDKKTAVMALYDPGDELNTKYLHLSQDEIDRKAMRIFEANCIALCSHQEMNINKSGLYQTISKINHSCSPNVIWTWIKEDSSKSIKQVRVIRDIMAGEEIVASYLSTNEYFPTRKERIKNLRMKWFFTCSCEVCNLQREEFEQNEEVRLEIQRLHDMVPMLACRGELTGALTCAYKKLKLLKSIEYEMLAEIPGALMECVELAAHLGKAKETKKLKSEAKEMAEKFGDVHLYNFNKKMQKITSIM